MIDVDDIGNAAVFGGLPLLIVFVVWYLVFSKPEIDQCHKDGGVIVRIEGTDTCVNKDALTPIKSKT